jgi:hypothetical protein
MESQARHGTQVTGENVRQPARLDRPNAHAEWLGGSGAYNFAGFIHGHAEELTRNVRGVGFEISVSMQVVRADRPVQGRR